MDPYRTEAEMPEEPEEVAEPKAWSDAKKCVVVGFSAGAVVDACVIVGNLEHMASRTAICTTIGCHAFVAAFVYIMWRTFPR